ncbi:hypothetical protein P9112_013428 [Eukaryota sp. TZLM1-RC]
MDFNEESRVPLVVCSQRHSVCGVCSDAVESCPICNEDILPSPEVNLSLRDIAKASCKEDLCVHIPSNQVKLLHMIGQGGYAQVFAASWFDSDVAAKTVALTEEGKKRLRKEIGIMAKIDHPFILRVFGLVSSMDRLAIIMELAEGSLPVPSRLTKQSLLFAKKICQAVRFLHSKSLAHGDLKPDNILFVNGQIKLADFGTSRTVAKTSTATNLSCTVRYAALEQLDNKVSLASDIYAIGIILCELLCNYRPFVNMEQVAIMGAKFLNKPLALSDQIPHVLKELIAQCCSSDPAARPSIAQVLLVLDQLDDFAEECDENPISINNDVQTQLQSANSTIESLRKNVADLESSNQQLTNDLTERDSRIAWLEEEKAGINASNKHLSNSLEERDARIATMEEALNANKAGIAEKDTEIANLRSTIDELEKQNTLLSRTNSDLGSRIADLEALLRECHCNQPLNNIDDHHPPSKDEILEDIKSNVNWNGLGYEVKKGVEGLVDGSITELNLQFNKITSEGASALARALESNSTLTELYLVSNNITSEGASALARALESNSTLTELYLVSNNITSEGASALARALESNSTLTELYLGHNNITSEGASALARALESNSSLTELNLGDNKITAEGASALARALESNSTLTELYLGHNKITSEGASALARALENNSTLTELYLGHNKITSEGASALARALENNSTLTELNLGDNKITAEGASALARALENNSTLTELNLGDNKITSEGASALARALENNSTLTTLDLGGNNITAEGASALARALESNSTLTELDLGFNNISDPTKSKLRQIESNRPSLNIFV